MQLVNRSAIILRPRRPYIEWANSLDDGAHHDEAMDVPDAFSVFLVPSFEMAADTKAFVDWNFAVFFEQWLEEWCTDSSLWPKPRTRKMFHEWFSVDVHSMVFDTVDIPYERE